MDSEGAIRAWVRAQARVMLLVPSYRIYFALPEKDEPELPLITLQRQGGPTDEWFDHPLIVFNCWGENKNQASMVATTLANAIAMSSLAAPLMVENYRIEAGHDPTITWRPESTWGKRYEVQATFTLCDLNR